MKPFRSILFPVDFSADSTAIVPWVREIALRFDAAVTLLHAFNAVPGYPCAPPLNAPEFDLNAVPYTAGLEENRRTSEERLQRFEAEHFADVRSSRRTVDGDPAAAIEWFARQEQPDLIVMPTKGTGRFRRLLLGSVTAKVLHDIECPVLTGAHEPTRAFHPAQGFRSIVCAVDLNREAAPVLDAAAFLAGAYTARLCVVHTERGSGLEVIKLDTVKARDLMDQAVSRVTAAAGPHAPIRSRIELITADVASGIREAAIAEDADLVVVGRGREKGALSRFWSHQYAIIRESPCPVLSIYDEPVPETTP